MAVESIRLIAVNICTAMAVTGMMSILIPTKSMERTIQLSIGLFFLASVIIPLNNGSFSFQWDMEDWEQEIPVYKMQETMEEQLSLLTEENLKKAVEDVLMNQGIVPEKIQLLINIKENKSIVITKLNIVLPTTQADRQQEVFNIVKETFGVIPDIVAGDRIQ